MTHFLRDEGNNTIVDLEFWTKTDYLPNRENGVDKHTYHELSVGIIIGSYSKFLLSLPDSQKESFIKVMDEIQEMRGWLWERYYMTKKNVGNEEDKDEIVKIIREVFRQVAKNYDGIYYVTD